MTTLDWFHQDSHVIRCAGTLRMLLLGLVFGAGLAGCSGPAAPPPAATAERPSILLLVLDACRPDKMGCYGYSRATTPTIDALANDPDAVRFDRHYVQGAWTKTSTASLFTGLFAFQHGVLEGHTAKNDQQDGRFTTQVLRDEFDSMAERLGRAGLYTFGLVKSYHLVPEYGFDQGFDDYFGPAEIRSDEGRVERALELIRDAEGPFFGYMHLNACHHPFPPEDRDREFMKRFGFEYDEAARRDSGVDFTVAEAKHAILHGDLKLTADDVRFLELIYDAKLRRVDARYVAPLIEGLRELEVYDNMLIVLSADHGEELYEHEGYAHGHALWDEVIHVPAIVKFPRGARPAALLREVLGVTQAIDLLPSFLGFLGETVPDDLPGADIFGGASRRFAYSETKRAWTMITDGYKYIEDCSGNFLFELAEDPREQHNLGAQQTAQVQALRAAAAALREFVVIRPGVAPSIGTELDSEAVEALRALGYLE